jgi:hypothetical protein
MLRMSCEIVALLAGQRCRKESHHLWIGIHCCEWVEITITPLPECEARSQELRHRATVARASDPTLRMKPVQTQGRCAGPVFGNVPERRGLAARSRARYPGGGVTPTCRMAEDAAVRVDVPSGTVTFLFTDVEGSTRDEVA